MPVPNFDRDGARRIRSARLTLGGVSFWLLFAGYFLYHFLVTLGAIPPVANAFFSIVLMISLPGYIWGTVVAMRRMPRLGLGTGGIVTMALMIWTIFWLALHFALDPGHPAHYQLLVTLVLWVGLMLLAFNLPIYSKLFQMACLGTLAMIGSMSIAFIDASTLMVEGASEQASASYQGMARGLMLIAAVAVCGRLEVLFRLLIASFTIVVLFVIGARSELYGFLAAYLTMEGLLNRKQPMAQIALVLMIIGAVWLVLQNLDLLYASRQLQVLDLSKSSSWVARQYMLQYAENQIAASPLLGVYGGHWNLGEGDYAHNALSAWVSLGFPGFVLFVGACLASALVSVIALVRMPESKLAMLSTIITMSNFLLIIVAKPMFWEMPALGWGLAVLTGHQMRMGCLSKT